MSDAQARFLDNNNNMNNNVSPKLRHEIIIKLHNGQALIGRTFLGFKERIIDMLNDDRNFIPVELENNQIMAVAKKYIMMIDTAERTAKSSTKFNTSLYQSALLDESFDNKKNKAPATDVNHDEIDSQNHYQAISNIQNNANSAQNTYSVEDQCVKLLKILNNDLFKKKRHNDQEFDYKISNFIQYFENQISAQNKR